jgi:hypothetical protein
MRFQYLVLQLVLGFASSAALGAQWYVAVSGSSSAQGSISDPWDLQTALNGPLKVAPGDVIWLRGGKYVGTYISKLQGTPGSPIIVRNYPGEWVVIDRAAMGLIPTTLDIRGGWTWYWGFEITNSNPVRSIATAGSNPNDARAQGITISGASNIKLINLVVHDSGNGIADNAGGDNTEIYGSVIYHNGWSSIDRSHGDGIYAQNQSSSKDILDNIFFSGFNEGLNIWGSDQASLNNFHIEGNIALNSGVLGSWFQHNLLIGGYGPCLAPVITSNYSYFSNQPQYGPGQTLNLGYSGGCSNALVLDNYFVSSALFIRNSNLYMKGNTFVGAVTFAGGNTPSEVLATYSNNQQIPLGTRPKGTYSFVRPNKFESGRGHIAIFNWDRLPYVNVDVSSILAQGAAYEVRDAQNFFGPPVLSGTYAGGSLAIPMTNTAVAAPIGATPDYVHTDTEFGAFVIIPPGVVRGSSLPSALTTPILSPNGGAWTTSVLATIVGLSPGASIYYTTDGRDPTSSSFLYAGPFAIHSTTQVKTRVVKPGMADSPIVSATFVIRHEGTSVRTNRGRNGR